MVLIQGGRPLSVPDVVPVLLPVSVPMVVPLLLSPAKSDGCIGNVNVFRLVADSDVSLRSFHFRVLSQLPPFRSSK